MCANALWASVVQVITKQKTNSSCGISKIKKHAPFCFAMLCTGYIVSFLLIHVIYLSLYVSYDFLSACEVTLCD